MALVVYAKQIRVASKKKCYKVVDTEWYSVTQSLCTESVCMIMVTVEPLHSSFGSSKLGKGWRLALPPVTPRPCGNIICPELLAPACKQALCRVWI